MLGAQRADRRDAPEGDMMETEIFSGGVPEPVTTSAGHRGAPAGEANRVTFGLPQFAGVNARFLRPEESAPASQLRSLPLVLEAQGESSQAFLERFVREHSEAIVGAIHEHGAVLFRGFQVASERHFEAAISSVSSFRPMGG